MREGEKKDEGGKGGAEDLESLDSEDLKKSKIRFGAIFFGFQWKTKKRGSGGGSDCGGGGIAAGWKGGKERGREWEEWEWKEVRRWRGEAGDKAGLKIRACL